MTQGPDSQEDDLRRVDGRVARRFSGGGANPAASPVRVPTAACPPVHLVRESVLAPIFRGNPFPRESVGWAQRRVAGRHEMTNMGEQETKPSVKAVPEGWNLQCKNCGYSLTGLTSGRCPECGESFDARAMLRERPSERKRRDQARSATSLVATGWIMQLFPVTELYSQSVTGTGLLLCLVTLVMFLAALIVYRPFARTCLAAVAGAVLSLCLFWLCLAAGSIR